MTDGTLALCFDAPMQSWGIRSRGIVRDTMAEPTKSGVVGLLAAALGVERDDELAIAELAGLRLAVRVDREGVLERDFQTTQNVPTTQGTGRRTVVSERYYLADALFLVVLAGDGRLLGRVASAVRQPHWPLSLGRKAYVPARPLLGPDARPTGRSTDEVLRKHPWLETNARTAVPLRTVVECAPDYPLAQVRHDQPISFARGNRRFGSRSVRIGEVRPEDRGENTCS